jgi:peptide/nickel transport system permease protein
MFFYLLRRILYAVPIALAVGFVCFMLVQIAPGDPINAIVPPDAPQEVVEQVRRDYGLDKPLPVQFGLWLSRWCRATSGARWPPGGRSGRTCIRPSATR